MSNKAYCPKCDGWYFIGQDDENCPHNTIEDKERDYEKDLAERDIELNMLKASAINKQLIMLQKENKELKQEIERLSRFETERVKKLNEENELLKQEVEKHISFTYDKSITGDVKELFEDTVKERLQEQAENIFKDIEEYYDELSNRIMGFLISHSIDISDISEQFPKIKKKYCDINGKI